MNVKVKAKVIFYNDYTLRDSIRVKYTYKAEGFSKDEGYEYLICQYQSEITSDYNNRLIKELRLLTKEEVIKIVKDSIIKRLKFRIASATKEEEKNQLLKELNGIKFEFTIKEKL